MNFAIATDRNFIMQACVLLKSIECTQKSKSTIFILHDDLTELEKNLIVSQFNSEKLEIIFLFVKLDNFNFHTENKVHLSKATYFRLYLHKLLPPEIDRILYLDCDMIVLDDLEAFYEINFYGKPCAAVIDMFNNSNEIYQRLNYQENTGYFNAGMILINLPVWKQEEISEKALAFIQSHPEKCVAHDQDALNKALSGNFIISSVKYNMQLDFFRHFSNLIIDKSFFTDISHSIQSPVIIHFTGPTKPWYKNCLHPYKKHWYHFLSKTTWKDYKSEYKFESHIKKIYYYIKLLLNKMHFYNYKKSFTKDSYICAEKIIQKMTENK